MVEFEDQGLKDRGWEELKRVEGNKMHAVLPLWPYMSYRFRVIAINDLGISDPSKPSDIHNTPAEGYMRFFNQMFHFFFTFPYSNANKHTLNMFSNHSARQQP